GDSVFRPARLRRADEPGARLLPRGAKTPRARQAHARPAHSRALLRDHRAVVPHALRQHPALRLRPVDAAVLALALGRRLNRASAGRRHAASLRVAGVPRDAPPKLLDDIAAFCAPFLKICDDLAALLTENRISKQRTVGIGVVTLADAWAWGFSGVIVRGSGA